MEITKVQFRKFKGEILAVFPYEVNYKGFVSSYAHIGQHSDCIWDINRHSKPCTESEFKPLYDELTHIGYNLQVIKRRSHSEYLKALHNLK